MAGELKPEGKGAKTTNSKKGRRNATEIRLLETKYGLKVLVKQGSNKVWLNQRHIMAILAAVVGKAFEERASEEQ